MQQRSVQLRRQASTQLPSSSRVLTTPPMQAGAWSASGIFPTALWLMAVVHALVWTAGGTTSLYAAFVNGKAARPFK